MSFRNVSEQQLNGGAKFMHRVSKSDGARWRLPHGLDQMFMGLRVVQLDGLDSAQIIQVTGPFAVAHLLRKGLFEHQFIRLIKYGFS